MFLYHFPCIVDPVRQYTVVAVTPDADNAAAAYLVWLAGNLVEDQLTQEDLAAKTIVPYRWTHYSANDVLSRPLKLIFLLFEQKALLHPFSFNGPNATSDFLPAFIAENQLVLRGVNWITTVAGPQTLARLIASGQKEAVVCHNQAGFSLNCPRPTGRQLDMTTPAGRSHAVALLSSLSVIVTAFLLSALFWSSHRQIGVDCYYGTVRVGWLNFHFIFHFFFHFFLPFFLLLKAVILTNSHRTTCTVLEDFFYHSVQPTDRSSLNIPAGDKAHGNSRRRHQCGTKTYFSILGCDWLIDCGYENGKILFLCHTAREQTKTKYFSIFQNVEKLRMKKWNAVVSVW